MKQHRRAGDIGGRPSPARSASVNEAARQATKPPPRTVGHNGQRGRDTISQEAAAAVLFL